MFPVRHAARRRRRRPLRGTGGRPRL